MKMWKKMTNVLLVALVALSALAIAPVAAESVGIIAGAVNTDSNFLPITIEVRDNTVGTDTLAVNVYDASGLLTGTPNSAGQFSVPDFTYNNKDIIVNGDGVTPAVVTLSVPISNSVTVEAGKSYDVTVEVSGTGSGVVSQTYTSTLTIVPTEASPVQTQNGLIDDIDMTDTYAPGETVNVEVTLADANKDYKDVVVKASVSDDTGDRIGSKIESKEFNFREDDKDKVLDFSFPLPNDLDEGTYTLHVDVDSSDGIIDSLDASDGLDYTFAVERADDSLYFKDVEFNPTANAGDSMDFAVSLYNNGLNNEDSVKTSVTISGVGVSQTSGYFTVEQDEKVIRYYTLNLPSTMSAGEYQVTFHAWNEDVDVSRTENFVVAGTAGLPTGTVTGGATTSVDSTSKSIQTTTGGAYVVSVANNGDAAATYTVSLAGTEGWASGSVNPSTISLAPGTTGQVSVFVSPSDDTEGLHQFSVYVKDGDTIVDSIALTANVVKDTSSSDLFKTSTSVLAVALIALAVLMVWKKEGGNKPRRTKGRKSTKKKEVYY